MSSAQAVVIDELRRRRTTTFEAAGSGRLELEWSLLAYLCGIIILVTLAPFRFHSPSLHHFRWIGSQFDMISNVVLFVPLGFLYRLTRERHNDGIAFQVFMLGCCLSACIEICQLFQPSRYPSPSDVLSNGLGAWIGAGLCDRAQNYLNRQWIGRLGLELPLMNIVYLLIPLIWLNGLASAHNPYRARLAWILGLCGSVVIAGVYRNGIKEPRVLKLRLLALIAMCWFFASSLPALLASPSITLYGSGLVGLTVSCLVLLPAGERADQRRFEIPVLSRVWPLYVTYLAFLFLWPIPSHYVDWHGAWRLFGHGLSVNSILRLIEEFAAFTLLGYMVAESYGRRSNQTKSILKSCAWCGLASALLQLSLGFHPRHFASLSAGLLMFMGSAFGALIYWRQLSMIQRVLRNTAAWTKTGKYVDYAL